MTGPLNEHQAWAAYEADGPDAIAQQPAAVQLGVARVLGVELGRMDPRHPVAEVAKRDLATIYARAHPEPVKASPRDRQEANRVIAELTAHPAYIDPSHADHAAVSARVRQAYETRYRGEE